MGVMFVVLFFSSDLEKKFQQATHVFGVSLG